MSRRTIESIRSNSHELLKKLKDYRILLSTIMQPKKKLFELYFAKNLNRPLKSVTQSSRNNLPLEELSSIFQPLKKVLEFGIQPTD